MNKTTIVPKEHIANVWPEIENWDNILLNPLYDLPYAMFDGIAEVIVGVSGFSDNGAIAGAINEARHGISNIDAVKKTIYAYSHVISVL